MPPQFRPPSFVQPNQYPDLAGGLDAIFNAYQQAKQRERGDMLQNIQLAQSGVDPAAMQSDPSSEWKRLLGEAAAKRQKAGQMQDLEMRLTESQIARNLREPAAPGLGPSQTGKLLPPNNVMALNEGKSVARLLPEVEQALQENESLMGPVQGRAGSLNPYDTKAQTVDARFRTASQAFGRFMEGGVLRKEDEDKYRKMFPQLSDTPDVARNKLSIVRRMLAQKYEDDRSTLGRSGYDVTGFEALSIPDSIFGQKGGDQTPEAIKAAFKAGKITREQAKEKLKAVGY